MKRNNFENIIGQRFGRLIVLEFSHKDRYYCKYFKCQCDCGNTCLAMASGLRLNYYKSCGCLRKECGTRNIKFAIQGSKMKKRLPDGICAFNELYYTYKRNSKKRNIEFNLNKQEFEMLTKGNRFYCNAARFLINYVKRISSGYTYNGVDRVDNMKGYTIENCVSCCKYCNYSKNNRSIEDFYTWIEKVYNNIK